jgi:ATP-dependent exoDNAse (exonuclease V) beta subunit
VTQINGILAKPAIESWAVNLMSETCWEHPCDDQYAEETLSDYRSRIEPIYNERRSEAAIRGSAIHDFAENCLTFTLGDPQVSAVPGYEAQCEKLAQWIEDNIRVATAEQSFAHNIDGMGYGGRIDAYGWLNDGQSFVLDFKTQGCKGKPVYYPEWQYQLAAYHAWRKDTFGMLSLGPDGLAITRPDPVCISVVIDTNSPTIHVKYYTPDQISDALKVFTSIMSTWYAIKGL